MHKIIKIQQVVIGMSDILNWELTSILLPEGDCVQSKIKGRALHLETLLELYGRNY